MKIKLIKIQTDKLQYMIWEKDRFVRLDERRLAKFIPNYLDMTQRGREKHLKKWLKNEVSDIRCVECGPQLPNAMAKIKTDGRKRTCSDEDLRLGAQIFLDAMELFEPIETGYHLVADILCGQHAMALRAAEPSFHGISAISSDRPEVEALLRNMVLAAVPLCKWSGKNWEVHREAVLDYRTKEFLPKHVQDHTRLKAKCKKSKLDCSFFRWDKWTLELQKILVQEGLIKAASSGFRYRYDLLEIGKKDQTYVVAMPVRLLEDPANF